MKNQLFLISSIFILTACGISFGDPLQVAPSPKKAAPKSPDPTSCERLQANFENKVTLHDEPPQQIHIKREFQRVLRKNCEGQVVSDKVETVRPPRAHLVAAPSQELREETTAVQIFNSRTCAMVAGTLPASDVILLGELTPITGDKKGKIKMKLDMSPAVFTFQVDQGMNPIYYTYYKNCTMGQSTKQFPKVCDETDEIQSGVYNVDVTYSEETLPGETVVEAVGCGKK